MDWECSANVGKQRRIQGLFVGKLEEKKPLGRSRSRWEDNVMMDHHVAGCGVMDWIELAHDRDRCRALLNAVKNFRVP